MSALQQQIDEAKKRSAEALAAELHRIEYEHGARAKCPPDLQPKWVRGIDYNRTTSLRYEARDAAEVVAIIEAWRATSPEFLPIGKYQDSCATLTAYPWKEYQRPEALKVQQPDAIMARNSKGAGFDSVEFEFFPQVEGERFAVEIRLAFRAHVPGFHGYINAQYNRQGDCIGADKRQPSAYARAAYTVSFGGGSRDSADWRGVFPAAQLLEILTTEGK